MSKWLVENWLAILALVVASVGAWPVVIGYFRPISLKGSIKFLNATSGKDPPSDGFLLAVTLVNEGTKNLVWRKLEGTLSVEGRKKIALVPMLIPKTLLLEGGGCHNPTLCVSSRFCPVPRLTRTFF
jgi:hypothetical protein